MLVKRILVISVALLLLGYARIASAQAFRQGDQCVVAADEVINGSLFALCRTLDIDGTVSGSLFGAATLVTINGHVTGDIYLLAGQLDIHGAIGEDLLFAGPVLRIAPEARFDEPGSDVVSLSISTRLEAGAALPGSITGLGYQLALDGDVAGDIAFAGGALNISGAVGGSVDANVADPDSAAAIQWLSSLFPLLWNAELAPPGLRLSETGTITGSLRYASPGEGALLGQISGETTYTPIIVQPDLTQIISEQNTQGRELGLYLSQAFAEFLTLAVIGLIALAAAFRPLQAPARQLRRHPLLALAVGAGAVSLSFIVVLAAVVISVLLIAILSGLQIGGLTLAASAALTIINIGGTGLFYLVAVFISRVVLGLVLGRLLVQVAVGDDGSPRIAFIGLVVGVLVLAALASLPVIGWVINLAAVFAGTGAILLSLQTQMRGGRDPLPAAPVRVVAAEGRAEQRPLPPPLLDDKRQPPGMDNLPDGFNWWGEA